MIARNKSVNIKSDKSKNSNNSNSKNINEKQHCLVRTTTTTTFSALTAVTGNLYPSFPSTHDVLGVSAWCCEEDAATEMKTKRETTITLAKMITMITTMALMMMILPGSVGIAIECFVDVPRQDAIIIVLSATSLCVACVAEVTSLKTKRSFRRSNLGNLRRN